MTSDVTVRPFTQDDVPQLLELMKALARFEGYIDDFRITEAELIERGLGPAPQFEALVAHREGSPDLLGMTVIYLIPFTHTLRPKMVMKELFITKDARGLGLGTALFEAMLERARALDCYEVIWTVLKGNSPAEDFYRQRGASPDPVWDGWTITP